MNINKKYMLFSQFTILKVSVTKLKLPKIKKKLITMTNLLNKNLLKIPQILMNIHIDCHIE